MDIALLFSTIISTLIMISKVCSEVTSAKKNAGDGTPYLIGSLTPFNKTTWRDIRKYCCTHARIHPHGNNKSNVTLWSLIFIQTIIKSSRSSIKNIMYFYYEAPKINNLKSDIYFILGHAIMRFLVKLAASHRAFVQPAVHVHLAFGDSKNLCPTP